MELEEKFKNLKELLDLEKFPKPFLFKFIILSDEAKQIEVINCFDSKAEVKLNHSKTKKYTTINVMQTMNSSQAIIDRYLEVGKIEKVIHL